MGENAVMWWRFGLQWWWVFVVLMVAKAGDFYDCSANLPDRSFIGLSMHFVLQNLTLYDFLEGTL